MQVSCSLRPHAKLKPLSLDAVQLDSGFWKARQQVNRDTSVAHGYRMLEKTGAIDNMRAAAHRLDAEFRGYVFQDSDLYKWLEAAALVLGQQTDRELESNLRSLLSLLSSAQFPDGYLDSHFVIAKPNQRWTDLEWAHEMYCAGHLIEAGIAYKRATGNTQLLDIGTRFADHIDATFGEGKRAGLCGHPEIELALVELYRETNDARYLTLAKYFIDRRGHKTFSGLRHIGPLYMQDRVPVREAQEVEGHAVRQLYLNAGVTDLFLETGEPALLAAMERLWLDMMRGKMYLTGGVGARGYGEMFGEAYELPTKEAYCETCAAIASMMWNWRMLLATNDARYADALERLMYNGFLSGVALDGEHFFYENPLRSDGNDTRQEWFPCACCPPNVMRQIELITNYCATTTESGVQIHQYMNGMIKGETGDWRLETNYPWDGKVRVVCEGEGQAELALRVPGWCTKAELMVQGNRQPVQGGKYAQLRRDWKRGDTVELNLAMPPHFVQSHPYVEATRGCVAIERGPLVYCIEQADQTADVNDIRIHPKGELQAVWNPDTCQGVMTIKAEGGVLDPALWSDTLYGNAEQNPPNPARIELTAIPYYAWNNRGPGKMRVWIPVL